MCSTNLQKEGNAAAGDSTSLGLLCALQPRLREEFGEVADAMYVNKLRLVAITPQQVSKKTARSTGTLWLRGGQFSGSQARWSETDLALIFLSGFSKECSHRRPELRALLYKGWQLAARLPFDWPVNFTSSLYWAIDKRFNRTENGVGGKNDARSNH